MGRDTGMAMGMGMGMGSMQKMSQIVRSKDAFSKVTLSALFFLQLLYNKTG
jgi:hypothetical protein